MKSPFISLIRFVQRKSVSSQIAGQYLPRGVQSFQTDDILLKNLCHIFWFKHCVYKSGSKRRNRYNLTSIQDILNKGQLPPCCILTSKGDSFYYQFSVELSQLFADNKIEHEYIKYNSLDWILEHCFNIMHPDYPESIDTNQDLLRFINAHIQAMKTLFSVLTLVKNQQIIYYLFHKKEFLKDELFNQINPRS